MDVRDRILRQIEPSWIASRTGAEPHLARRALETVVPDVLMALEERYRSTGTLEEILGPETPKKERRPRTPTFPSWTLDLLAV